MPQLKYGSYTHPDSPAVSIRRERRANPDGTDVWDHVTWTIRGMLSGYSSQANLLTARDALRTAYATHGQDLELRQAAGGTVLEALANSSTLSGIRVTQGPALEDNYGPEEVSLYHYVIVCEADAPATGSLSHYDDEQTTSYDLNERNLTTKTVRGRIRTPVGTSAEALFASKDPGAPSSLYHLASKAKQLDDQDTLLEYSYVYQEGPKAWPSGAYSPSVVETLDVDEDGRHILTVSATMYGPSAKTQVRRCRRGDLRLLSYSEAENEYEASFAATYRYLDTTQTRELISWRDSVTLEGGGRDFVLHPACDGGLPVRQDTVLKPWRAVQQGSAVGRSRFPAPPPHPYPQSALKPSQSALQHSGPRRTADRGFTEYEIAWTRVYEFPSNPGLRAPAKR